MLYYGFYLSCPMRARSRSAGRRRVPLPHLPGRACGILCLVVALAASGACDSTGPATCTERLDSGCWTFLGLDAERVTALAETPWGLYAGTHDHGVFKLETGSPRFPRWRALGLDHAIVSSILFAPGTTKRLLVGVRPYSDEQTDAALFASTNGGLTWAPWDGGLAARHDRRVWAYSLAADPGNPDRLFAGLGFPIIRSEDGGRTWQFVWGTENEIGGYPWIPALLISPARDGRVWAGGETALFTAAILGTSDWGDTWQFVDPTPGMEHGVWALALDPQRQGSIFAGAGNGVIRSDDAGATWRYVLITREVGIVHGLGIVDQSLYAVSQETRPAPVSGPPVTDLGLYRTRDGGETWDTLAVPVGTGGAQALAVDVQGRLLIGTRYGTRGAGVWQLEP